MDKSFPSSPGPSAAEGRLLILVGTLIWSIGGLFTKLLTTDNPLGLNVPPVPGETIAFYRVLFAGLVLLPALRRSDFSFRPLMPVMVLSFAAMNYLYVKAVAEGSAANAVILQYTAPMWMYLGSVWLLGEPVDRRGSVALLFGLAGVGVILWGGWGGTQLPVLALGLGSGVAYASVVLCLRRLRDESSRWLTVLNHLGAAVLLLQFGLSRPVPTVPQLALLVVFGGVQMALPYWLVARGMRAVRTPEAGMIMLLEPLLNPLWVYLAVGERPAASTLAGGAFILGGLAWRYWPTRDPELRVKS
jgi:drug/metabolite transporter (DMT)-like permease